MPCTRVNTKRKVKFDYVQNLYAHILHVLAASVFIRFLCRVSDQIKKSIRPKYTFYKNKTFAIGKYDLRNNIVRYVYLIRLFA